MATKFPGILVPQAATNLPRDYAGYVVISDIDKTYLATQIDSLGGLLKAAFEAPERKANVPGFSILLRALRRGGGDEALRNPLFFVSASPPQMEQKILAKMSLDGVETDGIIFKNQLRNVRKGNFKKLREQVGYKLSALLSLWEELPASSRLLLFGDDSESDAVVYSLFRQVVSGRVQGRTLAELLMHLGVFRDDALRLGWASRHVRHASEPVEAVFINLETGSQPLYYSRFGSRLYATENSLQAALALYEKGFIRIQAVRSIARDLILHYDFNPRSLLRSLEEASRRGLFGVDTLDKLWPSLSEVGALPPPVAREASEGLATRLQVERFGAAREGRMELNELKRLYSEEGRY